MIPESDKIAPPRGVKNYIDSDVLTQARKRIEHIYQIFDEVYISFSGGKDSLAVLELASQVVKSMGGKDSDIKVLFMDEELIPDEVLDFVQAIYLSGRFDMKYYCLQMVAHKMVLGKKEIILQWDASRPHIRPMPPYAISDPTTVYDQYTTGLLTTEYKIGKICKMLGLRAAESLHRLNGIKSVKHNTHIAGSINNHIWTGRPIYDWLERDVFKFFYDYNIKYNPTYDSQMFNSQPLRVSSTISVMAANQYDKIRTLYPLYFDQVCTLFPDLLLHMRYAKHIQTDSVLDKYEHSFTGILKYIEHTLDSSQKAIATKRLVDCISARERKLKAGLDLPFGGYPLRYLFECIIKGRYKRSIIVRPHANKKDYEYENIPHGKH